MCQLASPANQSDGTSETDELPILLLRSISAPFFPLPVSFSFLSYLFTSMQLFLINSLIKDTTSKSQLRGLCLPGVCMRRKQEEETGPTLSSRRPPPLSAFTSSSTLARTRPSILSVVVPVSRPEQSQQLFNAQGELWLYPA